MTTQCHEPLPPSDEELMAWGDGEATEAVQAHLRACAVCQERARAYARDSAVLQALLQRVDCPDPLALGEYALDLLEGEERTVVAAHARDCASCAAEVALYRDDLRTPQPATMAQPVGVGRAVRRLIATLWSPPPSPAAMATRGEARLRAATYVAEEMQISIAVEADDPPRWLLLGLIVATGGSVAAEPGDGQQHLDVASLVEVAAGGTVVARAEVDDAGNFVCPALERGVYDVTLHLPDGIVVLPQVQVGPS